MATEFSVRSNDGESTTIIGVNAQKAHHRQSIYVSELSIIKRFPSYHTHRNREQCVGLPNRVPCCVKYADVTLEDVVCWISARGSFPSSQKCSVNMEKKIWATQMSTKENSESLTNISVVRVIVDAIRRMKALNPRLDRWSACSAPVTNMSMFSLGAHGTRFPPSKHSLDLNYTAPPALLIGIGTKIKNFWQMYDSRWAHTSEWTPPVCSFILTT